MDNTNGMMDFATEVVKEVAKDIYNDAGKPIVKPTGELIGIVPRTINAALTPLKKWILKREYSLEETRKLLEKKLQNVHPEDIQPPEPHIAVPAIQYISYCMDNEELRDMYANLLASSMNKVVKDDVHPGFVEIIKQLCPDEAKILRYLSTHNVIPTITLEYVNENGSGINIVTNFSDVGEITHCEKPLDVSAYFDNLIRLGLLKDSSLLSSLTNKNLYQPLKSHPYITSMINSTSSYPPEFTKASFDEGYMTLTEYGNNFCKICITPTNAESE